MDNPSQQFLFIAILAFVMILLIPILQKRTGKDITRMLFGIRSLKESEAEPLTKSPRKPRIRNGTKNELTAFVAQLLRFSSKMACALSLLVLSVIMGMLPVLPHYSWLPEVL